MSIQTVARKAQIRLKRRVGTRELPQKKMLEHVRSRNFQPHGRIAGHETLSEDLAPTNEDGWMVLKRSESRHACQVGRELFERVDPGHYFGEVVLVRTFAEQIFHHLLRSFHGAQERTLDRGDETLRALDSTADSPG